MSPAAAEPALSVPDPPLRDGLVALRPWRSEDIPGRIMAFADPSVTRFSWPLERAYTDEDAWDFYVFQQLALMRGEELHLAFVDPRDEELVLGGGSLHEIDRGAGRAAIGYWLAPGARGRGVATCATRMLAAWAFAELALERLELTCAPDNERSAAVARRCGFTREARLRSHLSFRGARRDTLVFSRLRAEADRRG